MSEEKKGSKELEHIDTILSKLDENDRKVMEEHLYGKRHPSVEVPENVAKAAEKSNFEVKAFKVPCQAEEIRKARIVRVGAIQNAIVLPTDAPVGKQRDAILERVGLMIDAAAGMNTHILCLMEAFHMPFAFCTRERMPWSEFAETLKGPTIKYCQAKAKKYDMVIVACILERDEVHSNTIWNTAVVIGTDGSVIGKHRKNHIPRVGDFNESTYYMEGNTGHPVFVTKYGKVAINICYGRHHPLNWLGFALNGAEIIVNPCATVGSISEPMWPIEGRNAAIANSVYTVNINRIGTEIFKNEFTSGNGKKAHHDFGHFYGSSYVACPNSSRTPGLSRTKEGLLVTELDLNMCRQVKDSWGLGMTARFEMYAKLLSEYIKHDYKPQCISEKLG